MKKRIFKHATQTGARLLFSILALLLVLTGCDFAPFKKVELPHNVGADGDEVYHEFSTLEEIGQFYEDYKKNNAGAFVLVDPQKIGAKDFYFGFCGSFKTLEDGTKSTKIYSSRSCFVLMIVKYRWQEYLVPVIFTIDARNEDLTFDDPSLWSWNQATREVCYSYEYDGKEMMELTWISEKTLPGEDFLNKVLEAIVVLK